ncbi:hypothetical protein VPH35_060963 [Triticum aestivum]|uniref:Uncharacterized protein n=1 Tax=Aegilops tauschii subsp. strangulata TaxID=200361 RepID=A0A453FLC5_AEGTS
MSGITEGGTSFLAEVVCSESGLTQHRISSMSRRGSVVCSDLKALHRPQATNGCRHLEFDAGQQIRFFVGVVLDLRNSRVTQSMFFLGGDSEFYRITFWVLFETCLP